MPVDLFPDPDKQKEMNRVEFIHSPPKEERGSSFWGAACKIKSLNNVRRAYKKLRQDIPAVHHIMLGYSLTMTNSEHEWTQR